MLDKDLFLKKYGLTNTSIEEALLTWSNLEEIYEDYLTRLNNYKNILLNFTNKLSDISGLKYIHQRVKDPEHLLEKIIRKKLIVDKNNYRDKITDILACKIIYLYKTDWPEIHKWIINNFGSNLHERPKVYTIKSEEAFYKDKDVEIILRDTYYQSVHYLVEFSDVKIEIQVRSIYQEAWGEIDHQLRYPYEVNNPVLNDFSKLLNELTIVSDKLAFLINNYKKLFNQEERIFLTPSQIESIKAEMSDEQFKRFREIVTSNYNLITIDELLKRIN